MQSQWNIKLNQEWKFLDKFGGKINGWKRLDSRKLHVMLRLQYMSRYWNFQRQWYIKLNQEWKFLDKFGGKINGWKRLDSRKFHVMFRL